MFWNGFTCDRTSAFAEAVWTFTFLEYVSGTVSVFAFIVLSFSTFSAEGSHGQDDAKTRFPGHHLRIALRGFFKRDRFDHGGYATQCAETKRCLTGSGVPRQAAFELAAPKYEIHGRDLDRLRPDAEGDQYAAGTRVLGGRGDCLARRSQDCPRAS